MAHGKPNHEPCPWGEVSEVMKNPQSNYIYKPQVMMQKHGIYQITTILVGFDCSTFLGGCYNCKAN